MRKYDSAVNKLIEYKKIGLFPIFSYYGFFLLQNVIDVFSVHKILTSSFAHVIRLGKSKKKKLKKFLEGKIELLKRRLD